MSNNALLEELLEKERHNVCRIKEIDEKTVAHGEISMRYSMEIIGEKNDEGYPLYIALHGGGQSETPEINNSQWEIMKSYYKGSVRNGIYIAPRGVRDTWNTHFNPESYCCYRRLIENMIIFFDADPNRVYLLGYSAGGDGVYQIAPRMADFFAAANMSAGHPNGVDLTNIKNMPMYIQCGEEDFAYGRNAETARYAEKENITAFIHRGKGHQIGDNRADLQKTLSGLCDTNAVRLVSKHVREPYPTELEWNLSYRTDDFFYYVEADRREGLVTVKREGNSFAISGAARAIYLNESFVDFSREVTLDLGGRKISVKPEFSEEVLIGSFKRRFDKYLAFTAKIDLEDLR